MATTPPLQAIVDTPPTPLHGARFDTFQPSSTRKSSRQSTQRLRRATCTPPPPPTNYSSTSRTFATAYSPPSSNPTSPQTRANKKRRGNPTNNANSTADGTSSFTRAQMDPSNTSHTESAALSLGSDMLPTPAKTPRKKDMCKTSERLQSAARVLFPERLETVEDAMPNKKDRRRRKNVGFSLDSSGEDDDSASRVQIFTDSKEKIPEQDTSKNNPFINQPQIYRPAESQRYPGSRGKKASIKSNPQIEDAFNHEEGMVYVFRGKKIFRRFTPDPDHPNLSSEETEIEGPASPRLRPSTRASIKPRLLFPTAKQLREREFAAEEAPTDIEDEIVDKEEKLATPVKQSFAPATPPTTGHLTRSASKKAAMNGDSSPLGSYDLLIDGTTTPAERRPRKKTSPFDVWQRTKIGGPPVNRNCRKRGVEETEGIVEMTNKRSRPKASV